MIHDFSYTLPLTVKESSFTIDSYDEDYYVFNVTVVNSKMNGNEGIVVEYNGRTYTAFGNTNTENHYDEYGVGIKIDNRMINVYVLNSENSYTIWVEEEEVEQ